MIGESLSHVRAACIAAGIPERQVFTVESATRTTRVPQAVVLLDAQRTRMEVDGSLIATRIDDGPPKARVRRRRSHRVTAVVVAEITHKDVDTTAALGRAVVRALGRGLFDQSGMWIAVRRSQVEFAESRAQTAQGRTTAMVIVEFHGGHWDDQTAPLANDVAPEGSFA